MKLFAQPSIENFYWFKFYTSLDIVITDYTTFKLQGKEIILQPSTDWITANLKNIKDVTLLLFDLKHINMELISKVGHIKVFSNKQRKLLQDNNIKATLFNKKLFTPKQISGNKFTVFDVPLRYMTNDILTIMKHMEKPITYIGHKNCENMPDQYAFLIEMIRCDIQLASYPIVNCCHPFISNVKHYIYFEDYEYFNIGKQFFSNSKVI